MSTSPRPAPLPSSIWDLPTTAISAPDKPMLYSDAVCIMNDIPSKQNLPEIAADLPDLLCHTTFPPLPTASPRPASTPSPRPASTTPRPVPIPSSRPAPTASPRPASTTPRPVPIPSPRPA